MSSICGRSTEKLKASKRDPAALNNVSVLDVAQEQFHVHSKGVAGVGVGTGSQKD